MINPRMQDRKNARIQIYYRPEVQCTPPEILECRGTLTPLSRGASAASSSLSSISCRPHVIVSRQPAQRWHVVLSPLARRPGAAPILHPAPARAAALSTRRHNSPASSTCWRDRGFGTLRGTLQPSSRCACARRTSMCRNACGPKFCTPAASNASRTILRTPFAVVQNPRDRPTA